MSRSGRRRVRVALLSLALLPTLAAGGTAVAAGPAVLTGRAVPAVPAVTDAAERDRDGRFSIAVMPDTQMETIAGTERLAQRTRWLARERYREDLRYVTHVGDVVNWDTPRHEQYKRVERSTAFLDRVGIPWSFGVGNHDTLATCEGGSACPGDTTALQRRTETFNRYFGPDRATALAGTMEPGKVDNSYATFTAADADFLVLHLELWPRQAAIDWADGVLADHPDHNVVVVTHSYLERDGSLKQDAGGYGATSPQHLWDTLLSRHANVRLVLSGHTGTTAHRVDTGVAGNPVHSVLTSYHDRVGNPTRMIEVDVQAGTLTTRVYSPSTGATFDDGSAFTVTGMDWVR